MFNFAEAIRVAQKRQNERPLSIWSTAEAAKDTGAKLLATLFPRDFTTVIRTEAQYTSGGYRFFYYFRHKGVVYKLFQRHSDVDFELRVDGTTTRYNLVLTPYFQQENLDELMLTLGGRS